MGYLMPKFVSFINKGQQPLIYIINWKGFVYLLCTTKQFDAKLPSLVGMIIGNTWRFNVKKKMLLILEKLDLHRDGISNNKYEAKM